MVVALREIKQQHCEAVRKEFRYHRRVLNRFFKKKPTVSKVSILLLQKKLERYGSERLNTAMQRAWWKPYDEKTFFALSIFDGNGAMIKAFGRFFSMVHSERWLSSKELGDHELPSWAVHTGYSSLEYGCPGGVPPGEERGMLYGLLGLLRAELITPQTVGLFFTEERVFLKNTAELQKQLRSGKSLDPTTM